MINRTVIARAIIEALNENLAIGNIGYTVAASLEGRQIDLEAEQSMVFVRIDNSEFTYEHIANQDNTKRNQVPEQVEIVTAVIIEAVGGSVAAQENLLHELLQTLGGLNIGEYPTGAIVRLVRAGSSMRMQDTSKRRMLTIDVEVTQKTAI